MHIPVLKDEILYHLGVKPGETYLDGTFGRGGHTQAMILAGGNVVALDQDADAIAYGKEVFASEIEAKKLTLLHANFSQLSAVLAQAGYEKHSFSGALFDFGMSSNQIDESGRGFTFQRDEPLDMRMNVELGVTAADLLNALPEKHLKSLFWDNSQETFASAIARAVVGRRERKPWSTTKELAEMISQIKRGRQEGKIHPATKVFQALRMAVNMELDSLTMVLDQVLPWMQPESSIAFMSFHEGEDRLVKQSVKQWERLGKGLQITAKPIMPSEEEIARNPRSRSAKLRIIKVV